MLLKLYSIFATFLIIALVLKPNNSINKTIENTKTNNVIHEVTQLSKIKTSCETGEDTFANFPVINSDIASNIKAELDRYKNYLEITPDEERRLEKFLKEKELLKYSNIDLETYYKMREQYDSVESILGKEKVELLEKREKEEMDKSSLYNYQKLAGYYAKILNLDQQKQELLVTLLSSNDQNREAEISYMSKELNLNESQQDELNSIFDKYWEDWNFIIEKAKENGVNVEDEGFDHITYRNVLLREKASDFLDVKQLEALDRYFKEMK